MQDKGNVKERRFTHCFLDPLAERLNKWIEQINNVALESFSDSVIDECNQKEQAAKDCLNAIAGFYADIYDYSVVQKALADCKKLGFR